MATYLGLPSGIPRPPSIRAAVYLDLQLTNADSGDTIAGEFLSPSPIFPNDPILPPSPALPSNPVLTPNPIRLAWWDGSDWSPVLIPTDPIIPPDCDSVLNRFTFAYAGYPFELEGRPAGSERWLLQRGLQWLTRAPFPEMPRA